MTVTGRQTICEMLSIHLSMDLFDYVIFFCRIIHSTGLLHRQLTFHVLVRLHNNSQDKTDFMTDMICAFRCIQNNK